MDILTNKTYATYDYTCRYTSVPYYYNTADKKYIYGIGTQLKNTTVFVLHEVSDRDNLDYLALKYYGNPSYWWVIADYNRIADPFIHLIDRYTTLKIPTLNSIEFGNDR